jgi:hypothetical protein
MAVYLEDYPECIEIAPKETLALESSPQPLYQSHRTEKFPLRAQSYLVDLNCRE